MTLEMADLEKTATLAHLKLDPEKKESLLIAMNNILDQVKTINALDLSTVKPMATVIEQDQYQRKDIPKTPDNLLLEKNAPEWEQGAFKVPQILKK